MSTKCKSVAVKKNEVLTEKCQKLLSKRSKWCVILKMFNKCLCVGKSKKKKKKDSGGVTGVSTRPQLLTDGHAAVRAAEVDVALGDGCHADLVKGPCKEGCKGAAEGHRPVTCGTAHGDAHLGAEWVVSAPRRERVARGPRTPRAHLLGGEGSVILVTVNSPPPMQVILCTH